MNVLERALKDIGIQPKKAILYSNYLASLNYVDYTLFCLEFGLEHSERNKILDHLTNSRLLTPEIASKNNKRFWTEFALKEQLLSKLKGKLSNYEENI